MKAKTNERNGSEPAAEAAETETGDVFETQAETAPKMISVRLRKALIRCVVALGAAIVLLAATRFSVFEIMKGPKESPSIESEEKGAFVKRDIYAILGYSEDEKSGESTVGEYAVVPINSKFVVVHLPRRYLDAADTVLSETKAYIEGGSAGLDKYFVVDGTTAKLTDAQSKALNDWFTSNKDWLVQTRVIDSTADPATYLSGSILEVDRISGMSQLAVVVLSSIAGLLLVYIAVELILMACGHYLDGGKKAAFIEADETSAGETTEETAAESENADTSETAESAEAPDAETAADEKREDE